MKQPCASAAKLRGGGPILITVWKPRSYAGHRHLGPLSAALYGAFQSQADFTSPISYTVVREQLLVARRPTVIG